MNTDSMHKVVRLDENELQELTQEVKETLADGTMYPEKEINRFTNVRHVECLTPGTFCIFPDTQME